MLGPLTKLLLAMNTEFSIRIVDATDVGNSAPIWSIVQSTADKVLSTKLRTGKPNVDG